jgi:hypothetical protein
MKKQPDNLFATISSDQSATNKSELHDSQIISCNQSNIKTFTAADLWNIQRQGKSAIQRRHSTQ